MVTHFEILIVAACISLAERERILRNGARDNH